MGCLRTESSMPAPTSCTSMTLRPSTPGELASALLLHMQRAPLCHGGDADVKVVCSGGMVCSLCMWL